MSHKLELIGGEKEFECEWFLTPQNDSFSYPRMLLQLLVVVLCEISSKIGEIDEK